MIVVATLPLMLLGAGLDCPEGTRANKRTTPEAKEEWCERPDGLRHGPRQAWYPDGQRWFIGEYAHGQRIGRWSFWYPSGKPMSQAMYEADKADGPAVRWYEGGGKMVEGMCKAGFEDGRWIRWWPNGKKEIEVVFRGRKAPAQYWSRRGRQLDFDSWIGQKVRGAQPGSVSLERVRKRLLPRVIFQECRG